MTYVERLEALYKAVGRLLDGPTEDLVPTAVDMVVSAYDEVGKSNSLDGSKTY